jgi:hypothetical protein
MTDAEFQAYLDAHFPLGIVPKPLDPFWVLDDPDYFDGLRNSTNVSALDPAATLDTSSYWDVDADGALNACDNCPEIPNPGQGPVVFGQTVLATSLTAFSWFTPADVRFVRGSLASMATYQYDQTGDLSQATSLADADTPAVGTGFYYLLRPGGRCAAASWQSSPGAEPARDASLP